MAVLGILVGTASVVALVSSGKLATQKALDQFKSLGTDLMSVSFHDPSSQGKKDASVQEIDIDMLENLYSHVPEIKSIAPYASIYSSVHFKGKKISATILGITEKLEKIIKIDLKQGRFISFLDKYEYFCVIGDSVYNQIRSVTRSDPIGQQIQVGKFYYTIVGVANKWQENQFFNANINRSILIAMHSASVISKYATIRDLVMQIKPDVDLFEVENSITEFLQSISPTYQLNFKSAEQLLQRMEEQNNIFTLLLGLIGGISLFVGGIGVMNVMLVSVVERKREIGIRMAVGAKRKDIRTLFIIEAIALAVFGGFVGILVGILVSYIIALVSGWGFSLFILPPVLGFIVSVVTGVFFGYYPAYRASKLDPIQTLRYD